MVAVIEKTRIGGFFYAWKFVTECYIKTQLQVIGYFTVLCLLYLDHNFIGLFSLMIRTNLLIRYVLFINIFTFIIRGVDKRKSQAQKRRISEKTLLILTTIGWWIGAILGMQAFHHKTIKGKFLTRFRLITSIWIVGFLLLLFAL